MIQSFKGKKGGSSGRYPIIHFQFQLRVLWFIAVESEQISWITKICVSSLQNNEGIYIYIYVKKKHQGFKIMKVYVKKQSTGSQEF